jgi:hypothetical protein
MNTTLLLDLVKSAIIPLMAMGTTIALFWLKLYADARRNLDDRLFELEHAIFVPDNGATRSKIFQSRYPEIRKAAMELQRWMIDPAAKKRLEKALQAFRGQKHTSDYVRTMQGTKFEPVIDTFLTTDEARCLPPWDDQYESFMTRIAALRKITGSRVWDDHRDAI